MSQDKRLIRNEGKNSEVIQRQNRLLVLRIIREKKVISRVDLAKITGLKQATITNIANELIDSEYIVEAGLIEGKNGRRVNGLKMNLDKMRILVIRATSHYYAVGAYDIEGNCIQIEKIFWNVNESMQEKMNAISCLLYTSTARTS